MIRIRCLKDAFYCAASSTALAVNAMPAHAEQSDLGKRALTTEVNTRLEEIVVTAQRREQRIQDVPISITALSGDDLVRADVASTKDLPLVTPGLRMESTSFNVQPTLRGVVNYASGPGSEGSVAIYLDGVYQPFMGTNIFQLADVDRIEVLKGPQGTLFGRNATGGAILISTQEPDTGASTGRINISYGRFQDVAATGFLSIPLIRDTLALSISGSHEETDGWSRNLATGRRDGERRSDYVRGKLLFNPSESVELVLSAHYMDRHDDAVNAYSVLDGNTMGRRFGATIIPDEPFEIANDHPSVVNTEGYGVSLNGAIDVAGGVITSITSYQDLELHLLNDGDATPLPLVQITTDMPSLAKSQEVLFSSDWEGKLSLVTGVFAFERMDGYSPPVTNVTNGVLAAYVDSKARTKAYAAFAEGSYEVTPDLSLTAGVRYSYEKRRTVNNETRGALVVQKASFDSWTPKIALVYQAGPSTNVYATYSKGFKSGVVDSSSLTIIDPETLDAYEIGAKYSADRIRLDAAVFYYDYADLQQAFLNPAVGVSSIENAGAAEIYGAEVSGSVRITSEIRLHGGASYIHAEYEDYENASVVIPRTDVAGMPTFDGNRSVSLDLSGQRLSRTPRFTGTAAATYDRAFENGALELAATLYYSSWLGLETSNRIRQPGYEQLNVRAAWEFGTSGLKVGIYGRNLTDSTVIYATSISGRGDLVSYQEPRSYGITVSYGF